MEAAYTYCTVQTHVYCRAACLSASPYLSLTLNPKSYLGKDRHHRLVGEAGAQALHPRPGDHLCGVTRLLLKLAQRGLLRGRYHAGEGAYAW